MSSAETESALVEALKLKGIGPLGSRPIEVSLLESVFEEMKDSKSSQIQAAAFLMAFQILDSNEEEENAFQKLRTQNGHLYSEELQCILGLGEWEACETKRLVHQLISKLDLNELECKQVVKVLFSKQVSDVYKAALLQGLRIKRETDQENYYLLKELHSIAPRKVWSGKRLIDLAEPYDGYTRNPPLGLCLGMLLSVMGYPILLHGSKGLGPKYGNNVLTDTQLQNDLLSFDHAIQALDQFGIAFLDQAATWPDFAALIPLRNEMLKRPFLATLEKLCQPIVAKENNTLVCGYVHKAYRSSIPQFVSKCLPNTQFILVKGIEGGVVVDTTKKQIATCCKFGEMEEHEFVSHKFTLFSQRGLTNAIHLILTGGHERSVDICMTAANLIKMIDPNRDKDELESSLNTAFRSQACWARFQDVCDFYKGSID